VAGPEWSTEQPRSWREPEPPGVSPADGRRRQSGVRTSLRTRLLAPAPACSTAASAKSAARCCSPGAWRTSSCQDGTLLHGRASRHVEPAPTTSVGRSRTSCDGWSPWHPEPEVRVGAAQDLRRLPERRAPCRRGELGNGYLPSPRASATIWSRASARGSSISLSTIPRESHQAQGGADSPRAARAAGRGSDS